MHWDPWSSPDQDTYSTKFPIRSRRKSSIVYGASLLHSAIHATSATTLQNNLLSFLSYVKTQNIPILPVTKPDVRSVLGQGASFLVNGAEMPRSYTDPASGAFFPQGMIVAFKRAVLDRKDIEDMDELIAGRIHILMNELLTMHHPPLRTHPNIVKLLGIGFETEGPSDAQNAMPVLVPECAELGNLAEILETAKKEDRPLDFDAKMAMCLDIAHGIEILHACDIVHGDVKCENVLVFEKDGNADDLGDNSPSLHCKLTDFGVLRLPKERVQLGGSRPWQAPECSHAALFGIEDAKRTDIYSFGMLLWRVALDGDPFKSLGEMNGRSPRERRQRRNDAIGALKDKDDLVQHVCQSLALSEKFSQAQLHMLSEVVSVTLPKESLKRELDMKRIIRLLTPNNWFEARHGIAPARMPLDIEAQAHLLDLEKWHAEFESTSPVVQSLIASGFRNYAEGEVDKADEQHEEKQSAAAYQLAICYANGFGVASDPEKCIQWLGCAAKWGSHKAQEALLPINQVLNIGSPYLPIEGSQFEDDASALSSSWTTAGVSEDLNQHQHAHVNRNVLPEASKLSGEHAPSASYFIAAENSRYDVLESLLSDGVKPKTSSDGVSPIHFLSSWHPNKAEDLGRRLVAAGAEINAQAKQGSTVGGTPLMWSVFGNHMQHSLILIKLGADPMAASENGDDALSFAARLHLTEHLQMLLKNVRPALFEKHIGRLLEAATGGVSRFTRMVRHGERWSKAADDTFKLLRNWSDVMSETQNFQYLLLPAIRGALKSPYARMNTDVQMSLIKETKTGPEVLGDLLRDAVLTYNVDLFTTLIEYGVPVTGRYEHGKTLLHLTAKIPDHSLAATSFAPHLKANLDSIDDDHVTPWMEAVLERRWELADLLFAYGADPCIVDKFGFSILGLCIETLNLGAVKWLLKYSGAKAQFTKESFVNADKQISALQLVSSLTLPRSHGMKIEVVGLFLLILGHSLLHPDQLDFRSDGILPNASALDIAVYYGNIHAVKNLVKKGAHRVSGTSALKIVRERLQIPDMEYMQRKNLERSKFIIEEWDKNGTRARQLADDWTNMRTIDESHVNSSWEIVIFNYKDRKSA